MGADFLLTVVPVCELTPERIAALKAKLDEAFKDEEEDDYGNTKESIADSLDEYINCDFGSSREVGTLGIRGVTYLVTGGMSWGDEPTEAYGHLCRLDMFYDQLEAWALEDNKK